MPHPSLYICLDLAGIYLPILQHRSIYVLTMAFVALRCVLTALKIVSKLTTVADSRNPTFVTFLLRYLIAADMRSPIIMRMIHGLTE